MSEPFWQSLRARGDTVAIVDGASGAQWTYEKLGSEVQALAQVLKGRERSLVVLFADTDVASIVSYLAALTAGHAILLSPIGAHQPGARVLLERYRPEIVLGAVKDSRLLVECGYRHEAGSAGTRQLWSRLAPQHPAPHPALGVVLSTSASSGSPKAARLSLTGLAAGAAQVAAALSLNGNDRALLSLPFSYVYGLSVLNSTLHAGGSLVCQPGSLADRQYWSRVASAQPTMIAAVSLTFNYLRQLNVEAGSLPTLRKLTHSGDALDPHAFDWVYAHFARRGVNLYLMYGQTEAGGRITVLQPQYLPGMRESAGQALPGSGLSLAADGQIIFRGPAVMLGYAEGRDDLALGDCLHGVLPTGDLGHLDESGFLFITGRASRSCKVFGHRINLDDVESYARDFAPAAVIEKNSVIVICVEADPPPQMLSPLHLARRFGLPPQSFAIRTMPVLPRTERGKLAYSTLGAMV